MYNQTKHFSVFFPIFFFSVYQFFNPLQKMYNHSLFIYYGLNPLFHGLHPLSYGLHPSLFYSIILAFYLFAKNAQSFSFSWQRQIIRQSICQSFFQDFFFLLINFLIFCKRRTTSLHLSLTASFFSFMVFILCPLYSIIFVFYFVARGQ